MELEYKDMIKILNTNDKIKNRFLYSLVETIIQDKLNNLNSIKDSTIYIHKEGGEVVYNLVYNEEKFYDGLDEEIEFEPEFDN